jgi:hypothetical protein
MRDGAPRDACQEDPVTTAVPAAAPAAPVARQKPAITRDRYHRYTYAGRTYPGVTTVLRVLDKSDALMAWASRNTAEAALAQLDHLASLRDTVGPEGVIKALTARSGWKRDEAAAAGSDIHGLAERIARGEALPHVPQAIRAQVEAYAAWWAGSGWRLRVAEAFVVEPTLGYGGTLDLLAYDEAGRTVLADVKSGANVYPEVVLQLLAYGEAALIAPQGSPIAYPMPRIERYAVLHVTDAGVRVIDVEVDDEDRAAFRACLPLARWHGARKGQRL